MVLTIKSRDNRTLKLIRSLKKRKYREKEGKFILEGRLAIEEALEQGIKPELLVMSESFYSKNPENHIWSKVGGNSFDRYLVSDQIFAGLCQTEEPQGVLALYRKRETTWEGFFLHPNPFLIVVDGLQDPGNLGTIIRTGAAVNADGILLADGTVDLYNDKTLRSTMGAIFRIRLLQGINRNEIVEQCGKQGLPLVVADPKGKIPYYQWDFTQGMVLVIGSEHQGPDQIFVEKADAQIYIPMPGSMESLNAGVAAGIMMFEKVRQMNIK